MIPYLKLEILKNHTLSGGTYLYSPSIYGIIPPLPQRLHVSRGKQTWIWTTNARLFMNFLLLNVAFVI